MSLELLSEDISLGLGAIFAASFVDVPGFLVILLRRSGGSNRFSDGKASAGPVWDFLLILHIFSLG